MLKKILFLVLAGGIPIGLGAQETTKDWLQNYLDSRFQTPVDEKDWYLEINGVKLPKKPLEQGLADLEEKMKKGSLTKGEKKTLRAQFVQNYTDRMVLFLNTYQDLLTSADVETLLWDFMVQNSAQKYLEKQLAQDPSVVEPTEADINAYAKEHSTRFMKLGLGAAQIREYAAMELSQTKMQAWTAKQLEAVKNKTKIITNKSVQKELGL